MARPKKTSRITPKGTRPVGTPPPERGHVDDLGQSPAWMAYLMGLMFLIGIVVIVTNYLGWMPGSPDSAWILVGLGFVLVGIVTAIDACRGFGELLRARFGGDDGGRAA